MCVGPALGGVRPVRRPRPDRDRRGARRLVQAGGRSPLRRPRGGRAPRRRGGRRAAGRQRHAAAGEPRALPAAHAAPAAWTTAACPPVEIVGMLGVQGALHERTRAALDEVRRRGEKAIVLLNRRGWSNFLSCRSLRARVGVPRLRRDARAAPGRRRDRLPPLRPPRAGAPELPRLRVGVRGPPRRGHRAAGARRSRS